MTEVIDLKAIEALNNRHQRKKKTLIYNFIQRFTAICCLMMLSSHHLCLDTR